MKEERIYTTFLDAFWREYRQNPMSATAFLLYDFLLRKARENKWQPFKISDANLVSELRISRRHLPEYREELKERNLIQFSTFGTGRNGGVVYQFNDDKLRQKEQFNDDNSHRVSGLISPSRTHAHAPAPPPPSIDNNINIYNNKTMMTEKGGVGENNGSREEKKPETDFDRARARLEGFVSEMKNSPSWGEVMCKNNHISKAELQERLDGFLVHCLSEGKEHESLRETKSHFNRWLQRVTEIENEKARQKDETVREDRFARRRGTDTKARSASDYSTSF